MVLTDKDLIQYEYRLHLISVKFFVGTEFVLFLSQISLHFLYWSFKYKKAHAMPATSVKGSLLNSFFLVSCSCHISALHFTTNVFQNYLLKLSLFRICLSVYLSDSSVVNPGFSKGERATPKVRALTHYLAKFSPKTAWKWKIFAPRSEGARVRGAPLDPPLPFHPDCPLWYQSLFRVYC